METLIRYYYPIIIHFYGNLVIYGNQFPDVRTQVPRQMILVFIFTLKIVKLIKVSYTAKKPKLFCIFEILYLDSEL